MIGVSIVIALYNPGDLLKHCLNSIFAQQFKNFELILVNDGSTDSSEEIIYSFIDNYKDKIKYVATENHGVSAARNKGMSMAEGKYIAFVDADDYISEDYLEELFTNAEKNQSEMIVSGQYKAMPDGSIVDKILYPEDLTGNCPLRRLNNHGKMYRRDFLEEQGIIFPVGKIYEDNLFNLMTYFLSKNLVFLSYAGYYQVVHEGSITSRKIHYSELPMQEMDRVIKQVLTNKERLQNEKLFEFTVLSFFTYFVFVRNKKKEYLDTKDRASDIEEVVKICDDFQRITKENFPKYMNNPYFNVFKYRELQLTQKAGSLAFAVLIKMNLLKPFTRIYYRL